VVDPCWAVSQHFPDHLLLLLLLLLLRPPEWRMLL
jgi:hypothetical protein